MGINGLLPNLKGITRPASLDNYRGLTVAVDAMSWLHKGVFACDVRTLAKYQFSQLGNEDFHDEMIRQDTHQNDAKSYSQGLINSYDNVLRSTKKVLNFDKYAHLKLQKELKTIEPEKIQMEISKCINYVTRNTLKLRNEYGMNVLLVIDGRALPSKDSINEKRRKDRLEAFQKGMELEKHHQSREKARNFFARACSISYPIRYELMQQCLKLDIPFMMAPYEADAQMTKLANIGLVDLIISEDSDLLAYGCPRVLFKIDFNTGKGEEIQILRDLADNDSLSFRNWTHDMFVYMCILSGCDYFEGIEGVGLKKAHKLVNIYRTPKKIFQHLQAKGNMPLHFEEAFWRAYRTFRHQRIYCPEKRSIAHLFPLEEDSNNRNMYDYLGPWMEPEVTESIANGLLHPELFVPWEDVNTKSEIKSASNDSNGLITDEEENRDTSNNKDLFAFFKPGDDTKRRSKHQSSSERPPLQEISINHNPSESASNMNFWDIVKAIPHHFHEYSSKLVGESFQPLSRTTKTNSYQKRLGVTKALQNLKKKVSSKRSLSTQKQDCTNLDMTNGPHQESLDVKEYYNNDSYSSTRKKSKGMEHDIRKHRLNVNEFSASNNVYGHNDKFMSNRSIRRNDIEEDSFIDFSREMTECNDNTQEYLSHNVVGDDTISTLFPNFPSAYDTFGTNDDNNFTRELTDNNSDPVEYEGSNLGELTTSEFHPRLPSVYDTFGNDERCNDIPCKFLDTTRSRRTMNSRDNDIKKYEYNNDENNLVDPSKNHRMYLSSNRKTGGLMLRKKQNTYVDVSVGSEKYLSDLQLNDDGSSSLINFDFNYNTDRAEHEACLETPLQNNSLYQITPSTELLDKDSYSFQNLSTVYDNSHMNQNHIIDRHHTEYKNFDDTISLNTVEPYHDISNLW